MHFKSGEWQVVAHSVPKEACNQPLPQWSSNLVVILGVQGVSSVPTQVLTCRTWQSDIEVYTTLPSSAVDAAINVYHPFSAWHQSEKGIGTDGNPKEYYKSCPCSF